MESESDMSDGPRGEFTFTVATPTFNRAHTLPRVYDSLCKQTFRDFEWLVVDDGSSDETRGLVSEWMETAPFSLRYFHQPNSGKAAAENKAAELARGDLLAVLDSDDWYVPTALETFVRLWTSIDLDAQQEYAGVVALCADPDGAVIGDPFPRDIIDTNFTELQSRFGVSGDKCGCNRIEIVREFPYPLFDGETRGTFESTVLRRIARKYRCRCTNEIVMIKEYQTDGITAAGGTLWVSSPRSAKLAVLESLRDRDLASGARSKKYAHHFRFSLHANLVSQSWKDSPSKLMWLVTVPLGLALYLRDRRRAGRRGAGRLSPDDRR